MAKAGRLSVAATQAALEAIEAQRVELLFRASRDERKVTDEILRIIPQSAELYRSAVRNFEFNTERLDGAARSACTNRRIAWPPCQNQTRRRSRLRASGDGRQRFVELRMKFLKNQVLPTW